MDREKEEAGFRRTEYRCGPEGGRIFGLLYRPEGIVHPPLIIFSHEMGRTHSSVAGYVEALVQDGFAVYIYDIRGASDQSRSEGSMQELSAMTASADLEMIVSELLQSGEFDADRVVLAGASLGGFASAVAAMRTPERFAGLVLLYPGFVLIADLHRDYGSLDRVPENFVFNGWFPVGRCFAADVWDFDPYSQIGRYEKPVLVLHGDSDPLLPISWSERVAAAYGNAEFHMVKGGQHGFRGPAQQEALLYIRQYLERIGVKDLPAGPEA
ncbi:MAG: alpha/beta fold hydrolase [Firmicutes bacterium]|nr:alpha/beta fold hydrolase [Bacillota bacterium]